MKKYDFTGETLKWYGRTLSRIRALKDFGDVEAGDLGGWIEKEENLSHEGEAEVYGEAKVYGEAIVCDEAEVCGQAKVYGEARVCGQAEVYDKAEVYGEAEVCDEARVCGQAEVCGNAVIKSMSDYITISPIGSRDDTTTAFRTADGVRVKCGCFYGSIEEFEKKVKKTHGDNQYGKEYLAFAELLKVRFGEK